MKGLMRHMQYYATNSMHARILINTVGSHLSECHLSEHRSTEHIAKPHPLCDHHV